MKQAWLIALALLGVLGWVITRPTTGSVLAFISERWVLATVAAAIHASTSVSRRKPRLLTDYENSWLAALPYRVSVPMRIAFGFTVQLVLLGVLCICIAAASSASWHDARTVWLGLVVGYILGGPAGWFAHGTASAAEARAQYAIVRRVREKWATAPSLHPLSFWPVASARALNNPQVSARTLLFVLLGLPLGTTGAEAIATGAGWMVGLYVLLNLVATLRTAFAAGWWLRPTPVRAGPFTRILISRVLLIQIGVFAVTLVFLGALEKPRLLYLALAGALAWLLFYISAAVIACNRATRAAGHDVRWLP